MVLNKTVTNNGVSITFEEIVYTGARLNLLFSMPEYQDIDPLAIYVDGEKLNTEESLRVLQAEDGFRGLWTIHITNLGHPYIDT